MTKLAALRYTALFMIALAIGVSASAQEKDKKKNIQPITRTVEGTVITNDNDTLMGKIKVKAAQEQYITSIYFMQKGKSKKIFNAFQVRKFKQIVPYPDRPDFGVDEVYYQSGQHPKDKSKKVFLPMDAWE